MEKGERETGREKGFDEKHEHVLKQIAVKAF